MFLHKSIYCPYNNYRYQWALKKLAPIQYRDQLLAA
ncbi:IS3 family transposase [Clostridium butyricum]